jgi:hypothetical protein
VRHAPDWSSAHRLTPIQPRGVDGTHFLREGSITRNQQCFKRAHPDLWHERSRAAVHVQSRALFVGFRSVPEPKPHRAVESSTVLMRNSKLWLRMVMQLYCCRVTAVHWLQVVGPSFARLKVGVLPHHRSHSMHEVAPESRVPNASDVCIL